MDSFCVSRLTTASFSCTQSRDPLQLRYGTPNPEVSSCFHHDVSFSPEPAYSHVIRAIYGLSYETFEVTGPQMVLTMKLTTFAWNVWDGRRPVEVS